MKDLIRYVPDDLVLDLAQPGYGHPRGEEIVTKWLRNCSRKNPVLMCEAHDSPVWLQHRRVRLTLDETRVWACHFDGRRCRPGGPSGMSDEHRRQTDYVVRAAEAAGHQTAVEVRLEGGKVRPDAVLYGPSAVAVEVQRSGLTASSARARTKKAITAGMSTSLWFTDWKGSPPWFFRVPSVGMNPQLEWSSLPPARAATVTTGLRVITAARCRVPDFSRCPKTRRAPCGAWHPKHDPWLGMTVDDVAARAPIGEIVPVQFGRDVLLASPQSRRVYEEVTERPAQLSLREEPEHRDGTGWVRSECASTSRWSPPRPAWSYADPDPEPAPPAPRPVYPVCTGCAQELWSPQSQARGTCEKCRLAGR
jgi:hypothetical protein